MKEGNYLAKIIDYGVGETKAGDPNIWVKFQVSDTNEKITWRGQLKTDKNIEITMKTLFAMGFRKKDLDVLAEGINSGALTVNRDYEIVIEDNEWEGKVYSRVKYVNIPGSAPSFKQLSKAEAVTKLAGLKGHVMAMRQSEGIKDEEPAAVEVSADDEIPF